MSRGVVSAVRDDPRVNRMTPAERHKWREEQRTAVYRLWDEDGELLYVGITYDVRERWRHHNKHKPWWPQVAHERFDWYETRPEAEEAEVHAIVVGNPVHNVEKNWPSYKANYRTRWLRERLEEARTELCTPRRPRARAKLAALKELERQLQVLEQHAPSGLGYWDGSSLTPAAEHVPDARLVSVRRWPGCGVLPVQAVIMSSRWQNGECPLCGGPVPCKVVKEMGEPYRDHPFYCL